MNTLNVCIGHLPFPQKYASFVDLTLSPVVCAGESGRRAIVRDELYGVNGHSLSEYAQLFWLHKHLDSLASGYSYLNLFHYRRFVARRPVEGNKAVNNPWITLIQADELDNFQDCFERDSSGNCFNSRVVFGDGVLTQYACAHVFEDILNFTKFLLEIEMFTPLDAARFLRTQELVPACSVGIYHVEVFRKLFAYLGAAAEFLASEYFVPREGYQRRNMGFLLERLHSFLILEMLGDAGSFGQNMMIADGNTATTTVERVG